MSKEKKLEQFEVDFYVAGKILTTLTVSARNFQDAVAVASREFKPTVRKV